MIFSNETLIHIGIMALGLCGFMVARHIYHHKRTGKLLVCPIQFDCNTVVNSDYSRFFGIPLELLGMYYYGFTFFLHLLFVVVPNQFGSSAILASTILASAAFLFSIYLVSILLFVLRKGCSWCFVSAGLSTLIFILGTLSKF
jgi:uncharacterized membrane protein